MKTAAITAAAILAVARAAVAAPPATPEGSGFLAMLFLGFGAVIVVTQLAPALTLFASMIAGFFSEGRAGGTAANGATEAR